MAIKDYKNNYIVKNIPFTTTIKCSFRKSWNAAKCPYTYGQVTATFHQYLYLNFQVLVDFLLFQDFMCMYIKQVFKVSSFIDFNRHTCNRQQYVCDKNRYRFPDRWDNRWDYQRFITILGGQFNYLFYFQNAVPKNVFLTGSSITKSRTVVLAYCVPRDATYVRHEIQNWQR